MLLPDLAAVESFILYFKAHRYEISISSPFRQLATKKEFFVFFSGLSTACIYGVCVCVVAGCSHKLLNF